MSDKNSITDFKALARAISLVENETDYHEALLQHLQPGQIPVIGFTGPPGAGKSTLLNAVIKNLLANGKKVGLVLVDPSSPFNFGALLGDRLRMSEHFTNPNLYIRSLASRGSLGGLSDKIIEVLEVMRSYAFDYIFIETVGVGQSEVEIAGLADTTVVVLVPEAGDTIQTMKAGLMEIADVFIINKADRAEAETIVAALSHQLQISGKKDIPVLKTVATENIGINELLSELTQPQHTAAHAERKLILLAHKVERIVSKHRMKNFDYNQVREALKKAMTKTNFNLYVFAKSYL